MKIALILAGDEDGGLENHVLELAEGLSKEKHEVHLIAHERFGLQTSPDVLFHPLNLAAWRYSPGNLIALRRVIANINPDIVHCHGGKSTQIVSIIKPFLTMPTVASIHALKKPKWYYRRLDAHICVSTGVAKAVQPKNPFVIYNGVAQGRVEASAWQNRPDQATKKILFIGRLVPVKGLDVLVKALPELDVSLTVAGDGPERHRLESIAHDLGVAHKIIWLGQVKSVSQLFGDTDLLVISSLREGFSYACAEALLARRAVISSDVPVANECIPTNGIAKPLSPASLTKTLQNALADLPHYYNEMSTAFEFAQDHFSLEAMIRNTLKVYQTLLGSNR